MSQILQLKTGQELTVNGALIDYKFLSFETYIAEKA